MKLVLEYARLCEQLSPDSQGSLTQDSQQTPRIQHTVPDHARGEPICTTVRLFQESQTTLDGGIWHEMTKAGTADDAARSKSTQKEREYREIIVRGVVRPSGRKKSRFAALFEENML
eukprot:IDg15927t1